MAKIKIVRCLWGDKGSTDRILSRRHKMDDDILAIKSHFQHPFTMLTFGRDNTKYSKEQGFDTCMVCDRSTWYDPLQETYVHKLYALRYAFCKYNQPLLYLDMDCLPNRSFDMNELVFKSTLSANLMQYKNPKCWWRTEQPRTILNGGFLYIEDENILSFIFKQYHIFKKEGKPINNDEPMIQRYIDELEGKWIGNEEYLNKYEPTGICSLNKWGVFPNKDSIFTHHLGIRARRFN